MLKVLDRTARYSCTLQVPIFHSPIRLRCSLHSSACAPRRVHLCQKYQQPQDQQRGWRWGAARLARDQASTPAIDEARVGPNQAKYSTYLPAPYGRSTHQDKPHQHTLTHKHTHTHTHTICTQSAHGAHRLHQKIHLPATEPKTRLAIPPGRPIQPRDWFSACWSCRWYGNTQ